MHVPSDTAPFKPVSLAVMGVVQHCNGCVVNVHSKFTYTCSSKFYDKSTLLLFISFLNSELFPWCDLQSDTMEMSIFLEIISAVPYY